MESHWIYVLILHIRFITWLQYDRIIHRIRSIKEILQVKVFLLSFKIDIEE